MNAVTAASSRSMTTSTQPSQTSRLEGMFESLQARIVKDHSRLPTAFRRGSYPSIAERTEASAIVAFVRSSLSVAADIDDVKKAVRLLRGGMKAPAGVDAEGVAEAYAMALEDAKSAALGLAVKNLIMGKAPDSFSKTFMPSAPELAAYCEYIERHWLSVAVLTERMLALPEEPEPEPPLSDEQMAERREQIKAMFSKVGAA